MKKLFIVPALLILLTMPANGEYYQKLNCEWSTWLDLTSIGLDYVTGIDLDIGLGPRMLSLNGVVNISESRGLPVAGTGYQQLDGQFHFGILSGAVYFKIMLSQDLNGTITVYNRQGQMITEGPIYLTRSSP